MMDAIKIAEKKRIEKEINENRLALRLMNFFIPDGLPADWVAAFEPTRFGIMMGYNPEKIKEVTVALQDKGWFKTGEHFDRNDAELKIHFTLDETKQIVTFEHRGPITLIIYVNTYSAGSTCVKRRVGEETVIKPIYEIVCKEGAS